jgi:DNA-binding MarR family transcriptional regulator
VKVPATDARVVAEAVEGLIAALVHQRRAERDPEPGTLSTFQGLTLATLVDHGPARLGSVANTLGTTDATASRTIDALEARGLAKRQADPDDARCVIVLATRAGAAEVRRRRRQLAALAERALEGLSDEEAHRVAASLAELQSLLDRR